MGNDSDGQKIIDRLINWANLKPDIRALLLTSSRANPNSPLDEFSDYDVILAAEDIKPYLENEGWLEDFGRVLVVYRDPVQSEFGFERFIRVTQYEDGLKIDFTLWPVGLLRHVAGMAILPDYIDDGYQVLVDKDGITHDLKEPSCRAFLPGPPTETEYRNFIEGFFSNAPYAAKHIRRGDYFPLKIMLNYMRYDKLRRLLEWKAEIEHNWSLPGGTYGKGLHKYLSPELLEELESTTASAGTEAVWEPLFGIIRLFGRTAKEVAKELGYTYPEDMEKRVISYLEKVREGKLP